MITINNKKLEFFIEKLMEKCRVEDVSLDWGYDSWDANEIEFTIDFLLKESKESEDGETENIDHTVSVTFERSKEHDDSSITISSRFMTMQKTISFVPSDAFFNKCLAFAKKNLEDTLNKREEWNTFLWQYKLLTGEEYYDESAD